MKQDLEFANSIKNVLTFLVKSDSEEEKKQLYDRGIELINAHFNTCPKCGYVNSGGKFCSECGQELAGEVKADTPEPDNVDYVIKSPNTSHIYAIVNTEVEAVHSLQKFLARGLSAVAYKRTFEKLQ